MRTIAALSASALLLLASPFAVGDTETSGFDALHALLESDQIADVHAVLVDHRGERVFERYYTAPDENWGEAIGEVTHTPERKHDLRSVSKSVSALLLGVALGHDWQQDLQRPVVQFFPARTGQLGKGFESVSLEDVLTMQAGIEWNEMTEPYGDGEGNYNPENDENRLYDTEDPLGLVLARDVLTEPGTEWYYNGGLTQLIGFVVQAETGMPFTDFLEASLFGPLGIEDYDWRRSEAWPESVPPATASGLRLTTRDMAKIGQLILDRGAWQGEQLVDPQWIDAMTARKVETIPWFNTDDMTSGYGYQWYRGDIDANDVIFAVGNGDQRILVFPDRHLVISIHAGRYNDFSQPTERLVSRAVLAALEGQSSH